MTDTPDIEGRATELRRAADQVMSLNLEGLDLGEVERRAALLQLLSEMTRTTVRCTSFNCSTHDPASSDAVAPHLNCDDYYCRAVKTMWT